MDSHAAPLASPLARARQAQVNRRAVWRAAAVRDMDEIVWYIAQRNERAAARLIEATAATIDHLLLFPKAGRRRRIVETAFPELRVIAIAGFRNYMIFYEPIVNGIRIIRVLHGARDVERVLQQDDDS